MRVNESMHGHIHFPDSNIVLAQIQPTCGIHAGQMWARSGPTLLGLKVQGFFHRISHFKLVYNRHLPINDKQMNLKLPTALHYLLFNNLCNLSKIVFLWLSGRALQKVVGSIPRQHSY